jgi:hypothetical protein
VTLCLDNLAEKGYLKRIPRDGRDVNAAVATEIASEARAEPEDSLAWTCFESEPLERGPHEAQFYKPLADISAALKAFGEQQGRRATCELKQGPCHYSEAETGGASHRIDATLRLVESTVPEFSHGHEAPIADIACNMGYKKDTRDAVKVTSFSYPCSTSLAHVILARTVDRSLAAHISAW